MALSKKENAKKSREYYKKNKKYREDKIAQRKKYASENKKKEAKYSKEYYWENPKYRQTKRNQALANKRAKKNN